MTAAKYISIYRAGMDMEQVEFMDEKELCIAY